MDSIEKEVDIERGYWSKHSSANGQTYYYNVKTGQSQWDKPECLQDEESEVEEEWQQYLTEDGKPYWYNRITRESKWQKPEEEQYTSGEEEDIIPPNPIDQFTQLLKDNKITSSVKWDSVVKQLQSDSRWKCIVSISHKKKIYNQYLEEMKKQEKEENKTKFSMAKEDFMKMLEEHKILSSDIKLWKVQSYLVTDARWKAIPDEKERENLFQDYLDKLYKQEQEQMKENRKTTTEDFRKRLQRHIEIGVLSHSSTWEECLKLFSQDRLLQQMLPIDALGVFEEVINPLYEQWRQSIISKYRQNRINFRELLQEHLAEGLLTHKTKWGQFVQTIQQDDRFICMLGQPGSQPHELFLDFISHLKQNHQLYKSELKMHLQQKGVKVLTNVSFEEVDAYFFDNQIWTKMPSHEKKYYYRYFQENIKQSSNIQSKRYKKMCKRYIKLLKSLPDYKSYEEMLPIINQKIQENPKLAGLVEEQKKAQYESFVANLQQLQSQQQQTQSQQIPIVPIVNQQQQQQIQQQQQQQQQSTQIQEEPIQQQQQTSEKDQSERKKKKKKEKKEKKEKKSKEEGSVRQDLSQVEPEKTKNVKQEHEPEPGEIQPNYDFNDQEKSKSKGKKHHKSHYKSKKHHKQ
ncbi:unnamed protein product (macronuclear) [Paramecium tetraurelia]|uniref:WW domain-containing protein n=1 Tax=Paramecium tetraurelia TaxID=5888 RepID=A0E9S6_PARTE|nr:uncharacterized protein GSPATT00024774001 [Paramecium tetraurelia]CAK92043.1 unnamed protein product [Paramecium tetraurelia]|eukprot:XP_001459440.1 hypothetical protein (macronuclear) [Paramecium tetraurelia strain d4-2]